jgi:hypothetical protein
MEEYRAQIDHLISKSDGEVVLNGSASHASMVVERMFSRALTEVRILTRAFDPAIYCDQYVLRSALDLLRSGRRLKVLVEDPLPSEIGKNPYFSDLKDIGDLQIRQVPDDLRGPIAINFALMDENGFRLEKDETGATALVSFGKSSMTSRLSELFSVVWEQSSAPSIT